MTSFGFLRRSFRQTQSAERIRAITTIGTTIPTAIFSCATWPFGLLLDVEGKVVNGFDATLASVGDTVDSERDDDDDDDDAEGDSVVCGSVGADGDDATELADVTLAAALSAALMTVQRLANTRLG